MNAAVQPVVIGDESGAEVEIVVDSDSEGVWEKIKEATNAVNKELNDGGVAMALAELQKLVDEKGGHGSPTSLQYSPTSVAPEGCQANPLQEAREMALENVKKRPQVEQTPVQQGIDLDADEVVEDAVKRLRQSAPGGLKLPWEFGFAGLVLGSGSNTFLDVGMNMNALKPSGKVPVVETVVEKQAVEAQKAPDDVGVVAKLFGGSKRKPMRVEEKELREKVKASWLVIIKVMGSSTPIFDMIERDGEEILEDVFAKKKTGTLQVRASALLLYVRWCQAKGFDPFPISEALAYVYVDELRKNNAPATRANSFRSSLAFCKGALLLPGVDEVLSSSRITGSAHRSFLNKRLLRQRDALTVSQVEILEHIVCGDYSLKDKVFAGHCLLCVYGRLRFGDSQHIEEEPFIEEQYLECGLSMHKTIHLAGRARRLLPVVAPTFGVSGSNWGEAYLKARAESGLRAWPGTPFLPAPILGSGWGAGKLHTTEGAMWLCEMLNRYGVAKEKLTNIGAHSLKATALSWLAKAGVEERIRRVLGYHVKPKDSSVVLYSRDALAGSLERLIEIVNCIRSGCFRPDVSRSGRWIDAPAEGQVLGQVSEVGIQEDDLSDDDEMLDVRREQPYSVTEEFEDRSIERLAVMCNPSSESEEQESEDDESEVERHMEAVVCNIVGPPKKATGILYRHGLTGTVHKGSVTEGKLACGRKITSLMMKLDEPLHAVGSMCKVCEGYHRA